MLDGASARRRLHAARAVRIPVDVSLAAARRATTVHAGELILGTVGIFAKHMIDIHLLSPWSKCFVGFMLLAIGLWASRQTWLLHHQGATRPRRTIEALLGVQSSPRPTQRRASWSQDAAGSATGAGVKSRWEAPRDAHGASARTPAAGHSVRCARPWRVACRLREVLRRSPSGRGVRELRGERHRAAEGAPHAMEGNQSPGRLFRHVCRGRG